jgi:hypothetical protein
MLALHATAPVAGQFSARARARLDLDSNARKRSNTAQHDARIAKGKRVADIVD